MFSACVIARNEEALLPRLLESLEGCDDVVVLDTGSTDRTADIARERGARVKEYVWRDDFADARNECALHARCEWVAWLDADMHFPPGEMARILEVLPKVPPFCDAVALQIVDEVEGGSWSSPRLYRPALCRFRGHVHEDLEAQHTMATPFRVLTGRVETDTQKETKGDRYIALLQAELEVDPFSPHALMYLRETAWIQRNYGVCAGYCKRMLEVATDYRCHHLLGLMAAQVEKWTDALDHAFSALRMYSSDPRVHCLIAEAFDHLGRPHESLTWYEAARAIPPEVRELGTKYIVESEDYTTVPLVGSASVLERLGRRARAVALLEEALAGTARHRALVATSLARVRA